MSTMATILGNFSSVFLVSRQFTNSKQCVFKPLNRTLNCVSATRLRVSSSEFIETNPSDPILVEEKEGEIISNKNSILACPICYSQLIWIGDPAFSLDTAPKSRLQCSTCKKEYGGNETHLELMAASGAKKYGETSPPSMEVFRNPLVSYVYERGWRQGFSVGGFPGPEKEFEMAKDFLKPVLGGNIIDASCGSGMFSRIFAKSGLFSLVVALDYSESMLRECYEFIKQEEGFPEENLILVKADIARLPFYSSSVDAVHAGAALHCWPSPSSAVAEISRVLRPGGVFVATTYILDGPSALPNFFKTLRQNVVQISGAHIFISEHELEDLCRTCGLVDFMCVRNGPFVMLSATKPT